MSDQGVDGGDAPFASAQNLKLLESVEVKLLDISVNGTLIARGEIVLVGERLGIRVSEIISPEQRLRNL